VAEVQYEKITGGRFRHGTGFLRWRPDKAPRQCTIEQVEQEGRSAMRLLRAPDAGRLRRRRVKAAARERR
jgi:ATP-dependent DNA ligase